MNENYWVEWAEPNSGKIHVYDGSVTEFVYASDRVGLDCCNHGNYCHQFSNFVEFLEIEGLKSATDVFELPVETIQKFYEVRESFESIHSDKIWVLHDAGDYYCSAELDENFLERIAIATDSRYVNLIKPEQ